MCSIEAVNSKGNFYHLEDLPRRLILKLLTIANGRIEHTYEHAKYTDHASYQTEVKAGDSNQDTATYNPFADLKSMLKK